MQGAIARVFHKYRTSIPLDSPFRQFGTRREDGRVFFRHGDSQTLTLSYLHEREVGSTKMELMLRAQVAVMDELKDAVKETKQQAEENWECALYLEAKKKDLQAANLKLEEDHGKLLDKVDKQEAMIYALHDQCAALTKEIMKLRNSPAEKVPADKMIEEASAIQENPEIEAPAAQDEESMSEPEERLMYGSDNEMVPVEEWEDYLARKEAKRAREAKRRNTTPLACLDRVKRQ